MIERDAPFRLRKLGTEPPRPNESRDDILTPRVHGGGASATTSHPSLRIFVLECETRAMAKW